MSVATMLPRTLPRQTAVELPAWVRLPLPVRSVPVAGISRDIRVQFAATRQDWEEALQLVTENYQARGFEEPGQRLRFTAFQALPDSVVLVAKEAGRVVATLSLVPDNTLLGVPLEGLYREQVQQLRLQGRHISEAGSLAERGLSFRQFLQVFLTLMQVAWQHMLRHGADTTVIAVNPRHSSFYRKLHGFVPLGPRRSYHRVQGAPAEAFYVTPELIRQRAPQMYPRIFTPVLPPSVLTAPAMPNHLIRCFAQRSSQTDAQTVEQIITHVQTSGSPRRW